MAADIVADRDQPPDPVSAMDGYAMLESDAIEGGTLRVVGGAPAGCPFDGSLQAGEAVRIATGGVVPDGAGRVVMQELVERDGERITLREAPGPSTFIRPRGYDFSRGDAIARTGEVLSPARIGVLAAANFAGLEVRFRPRVLILASGDELREPGSDLSPGAIVNSAGYALAELVEAWGGVATRSPILSDDREQCRFQVERAKLANFDVIVPLGGASIGDRDVLRPVMEDLGAHILFDGIAVQPGKPCWHASFTGGPVVVGLPGNPASAFVCAHLLVKPLMLTLLGRCDHDRLIRAALTHAMPEGGGRETYWRATLSADDEGRLLATPDPRLDSSLQLPLASANALIRREAGSAASEVGEIVNVVQIGPLG